MSELLEMAHLSYQDSMPEMYVRGCRVETCFNTKGDAGPGGFLEFYSKLLLRYAINSSFSQVCNLFVYCHCFFNPDRGRLQSKGIDSK